MTLIIGDIHGCYDELQALLDQAGIADDEPIITLGDIVDRGPASPQVLAFFRDHPRAQSLMGNHERKHIRAGRGKLKLATSQRIARQQIIEEGMDYEAALAFMATLPLFMELPEALLVHGYLEPGVPLAEQRPTVLTGTMTGEKYLKKRYERPWFELADCDKPVIVGHREYAGEGKPFIYGDRVYGLDTGCYRGKRLTGLVLPAFRLVSVPAARNYWLDMRHQYPHLLPKRRRPVPPEKMAWPNLAKWIAEDEERQAWARRMEAAQETFAEIVRWATVEHERIMATLPEFETLTRKKQGRRYDEAINHMPGPARRLLHRTRQGKLSEEDVGKVVRCLAEAETVLAYVNDDD